MLSRHLPQMERRNRLMERCMTLVDFGCSYCRDIFLITFRNENECSNQINLVGKFSL